MAIICDEFMIDFVQSRVRHRSRTSTWERKVETSDDLNNQYSLYESVRVRMKHLHNRDELSAPIEGRISIAREFQRQSRGWAGYRMLS